VPEFASSATEALQLLERASAEDRLYEVALLDHDMPDCNGAELGKRIYENPKWTSMRLVLLTSSGMRGDSPRFAALGFAGYLLKPVGQRDLVDCLLVVLGASADQWATQSQPIITHNELQVMRVKERNKRLLLAEDNPINQKVAERTLQTLGYRVDIVQNGREAVTAWRSGRYDLILMDCQMPELDGYEATREIRRLEAGHTRIPIIALTAHAMTGAELESKAAGMDEHLSKPIDGERLEACLAHFLAGTLTPPGIDVSATGSMRAIQDAARDSDTAGGPGIESPVDWEALLQSIDGDQAFARELASMFLGSGEESLAAIVAAHAQGDRVTLRKLAHSLKGACTNLRAAAATAAAAQLEAAAQEAQRDRMAGLVDALRSEVRRMIHYLQTKVA